MRKNHSFLTCMKGLTFLYMTFCSFVAKGQTLVGQTVDALPGDAFTYQSQSMPNYGVKWTSDPWYPGANTAWFSGYHGMKFFTYGAKRLSIYPSGIIEASAPVMINPDVAGNNYLQFKTNGVDLGIIGSSSGIYGANPSDLGIYVYGSGNLEFSTGATKRMLISSNGNIGIGNSNPQHKLDVSGYIVSAQSSNEGGLYLGNVNHGIKRFSGTNDVGLYTTSGKLSLSVNGEAANHMVITANGNIGIGTTNTATEKLSVKGKIRAQELKIEADNNMNWPDYVFELTYKPTPLPELEQFIKTHKHLPEIPSAKEVAADGIEVGTNQALLLKKIEELTLHIIEVNKSVESLNIQMSKLQQDNLELKTRVVQQENVLKRYTK